MSGSYDPPPPYDFLDGGVVPINLVKEIYKRLISGGSINQGNDGVWKGVHGFPTEMDVAGCWVWTVRWCHAGQGFGV